VCVAVGCPPLHGKLPGHHRRGSGRSSLLGRLLLAQLHPMANYGHSALCGAFSRCLVHAMVSVLDASGWGSLLSIKVHGPPRH
jgi:hypothetical protein